MNRRVILSSVVVIAIFLAGALAGAAVVRMVSPATDVPMARSEGAESGAEDEEGRDGPRNGPVYGLSQYLDQELELTDEQRVRVEEVLERREAEARRMFRESRTEFQTHLEATILDVKELLTPEQEEEFQNLIDRMDDRRRNRPEVEEYDR